MHYLCIANKKLKIHPNHPVKEALGISFDTVLTNVGEAFI